MERATSEDFDIEKHTRLGIKADEWRAHARQKYDVDPTSPITEESVDYFIVVSDSLEEDDPMATKPVLFYGKPESLDTVIAFAEIKFASDESFNNAPDKKAAYFASLFRGTALTWLIEEKRASDFKQEKGKSAPALLADYDSLVTLVRTKFGRTAEAIKSQAERRIHTTRQTTSVLEYQLRFEPDARILEWTEQTKIAAFKRGLKLHIREAIITNGHQFGTLQELAEEAARIDDELFASKRTAGHGRGKAGGNPAATTKCYKCGRFGHKRANCRSGGRREG